MTRPLPTCTPSPGSARGRMLASLRHGHPSSERPEECEQKRGAAWDLRDDDMLVVGVGAASDCAEAVEGGYADAGGEVSV